MSMCNTLHEIPVVRTT